MSTSKTRIQLGDGRVYDLDWIGANADTWQSHLKNNHRKPAFCLCNGGGRHPRLSIRRRKASDRYHLALFPNTGTQHHLACVFRSIESYRSGGDAYVPGVIRERKDGQVSIYLDIALLARKPRTAMPERGPSQPSPGGGAGRRTQRAMTVLGLLHLLWERGTLNYWHGEAGAHRGWRHVGETLRDEAAAIHVGKSRTLANHLLVFQPEGDQKARTEMIGRLHDQLVNLAEGHRRAVIVGELENPIADSLQGGSLNIFGARQAKVRFWVRPNRWDEISKRFGLEQRAAESAHKGSDREHCICIAVAGVQQPRGDDAYWRCDVEEVALMSVNRRFIPYASSYEKLVADKLIENQRTFRKPLRYDARTEMVLADFELLDTGDKLTPMEVFGRSDPKYQARTAEKKAFYDKHYGPNKWWHWDAVRETTLPEFPPSVAC